MYGAKNTINKLRYRIEAELAMAYTMHIKDGYDIEVAYLECGPTKVIAGSTNKKAKKIAWVHVDFSIAHDRQFVQKTKKYYYKYDEVVCVSEKCKESFEAYYGNKIKVSVIHNVVDKDEILYKSRKKLPSEYKKKRFTICNVGRLELQKNHMRLIAAVERLIHEGYEFDTWILGEGRERIKIEKQIEEGKIEDYVKLFGFQENPYPFMEQADLLVCTSDYEGFSTFVTEGTVLGKPILTTDCSGMHEILDNYPAGIIVENDDNAFYQGLKEALDNTAFYQTGEKCLANDTLKENESFFETLVYGDDRIIAGGV